MEERNIVSVKIFGQEYSISGDQSREYIMKLADHVDGKMNEIAGMSSSLPMSSVAVLAAVNMADEYFELLKSSDELRGGAERAKADSAKYEELMEEMKNSFIKAKQDLEKANLERGQVLSNAAAKDRQIADLYNQLTEAKKHNEVLRGRVAELSDSVQAAQAAPAEAQKMIADLEAKCRDTESSFFDIQMENIRLKNELDSLRKQMNSRY